MTTDADLPALPELATRTTVKDSLPVETVPWPTVTRYSGGASHEGVGGRVWIRLSDEGQEVEYVPATPAIAADRERAGAAVTEGMLQALRFYARGEHYITDDDEEFDTVSGEPDNWLCSGLENSSTMIEDGGIARSALQGKPLKWMSGDEDQTPQPIEGERAGSVDARVVDTSHLRGLDTSTRVRFYEHDFYVLSNFSAFTLEWKGLRFDTSEAAYHWEKFTGDSGEAQLARHYIRAAPSAHEAFKVAEWNKRHRRADWDDVKVGIMRDILRAKASQHEYVRRKLLATGDRELVEDSWRDDFWGWGPNRDGQNMLGKLWMEVRAELRTAIDAARSKP